ncbi:MAG TPA: ATP-binding protein [Terriglobales bacterium]|jgi:anti-sigma regulatory factor (Ser/Thr protein kinase)
MSSGVQPESTETDAGVEVLSSSPQLLQLSLPCTPAAVDRATTLASVLLRDLPTDTHDGLCRALRELLLNAIEWGGHFDSDLRVMFTGIRTARLVMLQISDPGAGFKTDPEHFDHCAVCNPEGDPIHHVQVREERGMRPGGLGLMIVRAAADDLVFNQSGNEVVLLKYL